MSSEITLPKPLEDALAKFGAAESPISEHTVFGTITSVRDDLADLSPEEIRGVTAEAAAFSFVGQNGHTSIWGTYFGPMMTGKDKNGAPVYFPNIDDVDPLVVAHWMRRAVVISHPVLKARYADLAWDMARASGSKPLPELARMAIDAYLDSTRANCRNDLHDRLSAAVRALDLAVQLKDTPRTSTARAALLDLHAVAVAAGGAFWWIAPTRLIDDKRAALTGSERDSLVKSVEDLVKAFGDERNKSFDPNAQQQAAELLKKYYRQTGSTTDVQRLDETVARSFETAANRADTLVAPSYLQSAINAFNRAGLKSEAARVRIAMQNAIGLSNKALRRFSREFEIKREDLENFLTAVVVDDPGTTLAMIAKEFLVSKDRTEKLLQELKNAAPLQMLISKQIMQDNHVAATIGSLENDQVGRLVHQADMSIDIAAPWLMHAFERAFEMHELTPDLLAGWANRHNIFDDTTFLKEGLEGWLDGDLFKAIHMLVPQVERGLRAIAASVGVPVTKAHPVTKGASVAVNMGDILSNERVVNSLGPDISLHFRALFADPRGKNLRNRVAHGLTSPQSLGPHIVRSVVHSLLVLGVWKELATR